MVWFANRHFFLVYGTESFPFAISAIFAITVCRDAMGYAEERKSELFIKKVKARLVPGILQLGNELSGEKEVLHKNIFSNTQSPILYEQNSEG